MWDCQNDRVRFSAQKFLHRLHPETLDLLLAQQRIVAVNIHPILLQGVNHLCSYQQSKCSVNTTNSSPVAVLQHPRHIHNNWLPVADQEHLLQRQPCKSLVRRVDDDAIHRALKPREGCDRLRPEALDLGGRKKRVVTIHINVKLLELVDHFSNRTLSSIRHVLFVGQTHNQDLRVPDHFTCPVQLLDRNI